MQFYVNYYCLSLSSSAQALEEFGQITLSNKVYRGSSKQLAERRPVANKYTSDITNKSTSDVESNSNIAHNSTSGVEYT